MVIAPVWLFLRVFELVDKYSRYSSHFGGLLYDKLYPSAIKHHRRAASIINKNDFAAYHEETIVDFPKILTKTEWQEIFDLLTQNINDIQAKIHKSNDAIDNDIMQFEVFEIKNFMGKYEKIVQ